MLSSFVCRSLLCLSGGTGRTRGAPTGRRQSARPVGPFSLLMLARAAGMLTAVPVSCRVPGLPPRDRRQDAPRRNGDRGPALVHACNPTLIYRQHRRPAYPRRTGYHADRIRAALLREPHSLLRAGRHIPPRSEAAGLTAVAAEADTQDARTLRRSSQKGGQQTQASSGEQTSRTARSTVQQPTDCFGQSRRAHNLANLGSPCISFTRDATPHSPHPPLG